MNPDGSILLWIQEFVRCDLLTPFMKAVTHLGDHGQLWILLTVVLLCCKKTRKAGAACAISLLLSLLVNNMILKPLVDRTRPYEVVQGLTLLIGKQKDASFPSGHTASSFAAAVVMFVMLPKRYGIPALLLAFLIGLSRLYVGVHYPTDVLCGLLSGTVLALLSVWIVKRLTAWYCKREGKE